MSINMTALWIVGIVCVIIGLGGVYASQKGWLK